MRNYFFKLGVLLLGALALVVGIVSVIKINKYEPVEALITRVEEYYNAGAGWEYTAFVDYTVGGKEYKDVRLDYYEDGYDEGKTIQIKYNPEDPSEITGDSMGFSVYLIVIGAICIGIDVAMLVRKEK